LVYFIDTTGTTVENCTTQTGVIESIQRNMARVTINTPSACSACSAKGGCGMFSTNKNTVDVPVSSGGFSVGDTVLVTMKNKQGFRAVALGYVLPFVILLLTLMSLNNLYNEGVAGLFALLSVVFYYILLWVFNKKITRSFSYNLIKQSTDIT